MVQIIAHRGARSIAPENTIVAAKKAFEAGANLWETDVSVTRDEYLILFHDPSLKRTTDIEKVFTDRTSDLCTDYTLSEILMLDAGSSYIEKDPFKEIQKGNISKEDLLSFKGEKVPTLEEALVFTMEKKWKINLELKNQPGVFINFSLPERVLNMIKYVGINLNQIIISSFNHSWLKQVQKMEPLIQIEALIGDAGATFLDWGDYCFSTYNASSSLVDEEQIARAKSKGKKINLFTVNCKDEMIRFINAGVDGFITDYPHRLATLRKK